jgi:radical SAM superfamily enzyme YgiQ (UPF0313 family)
VNGATSGQRRKIGLVQINNSFSRQNYLPCSVGLLQAYAQRHLARPDAFEFLLPIYRRIPVDEAVEALTGASVVFFSTYVWNVRISLEIARRLKARAPETLVVFGGPQVPDRAEAFLRQHPFVDLGCHGEGERIAVEILERSEARDWDGIPGLSRVRRDGTFVSQPKGSRLVDLGDIPSPYLEGVFEPLMAANPDEQWLVLWETNRGCPFSCTFCDWGSAVQSKVYTFPLERLFAEVEWFARHQVEFVFCCDANFGILKRDLDIAKFMVETKAKHGYPKAFSVQNTKNATERAYQVQKILADAGLNKGVTISLQSVDPGTLAAIKRQNISSASFQELQRRFTRDRVETYTDVILGLPGETYDTFADGVSAIIENGQHNRIQFNNLSILPNAEMADPDYRATHGMATVETKIVNIHGALDENAGDIYETQELVVATGTMPREDWRRARVFSWMAGLLHFDKVLQIPLVLAHEVCGVTYRELIEAFSDREWPDCPVVGGVRTLFFDKALDIQDGGPEYCRGTAWLNIWWPADEYALIKLCVERQHEAFYREAELMLRRFLKERFVEMPAKVLHDAVLLNRSLLKQPFQTENLEVRLSYNVWEVYTAAVAGERVPVQEGTYVYHIDRTSAAWSSWDDWCRDVIWYGNKKGAYLYGNNAVQRELAGHF